MVETSTKERLYEDYCDETVKFIILTAGCSSFFAAEPCRYSWVQTCLSTSSDSIKSDTSQISIFINVQAQIFVILITIGKLSYEDRNEGHLESSWINHSVSLQIYLSDSLLSWPCDLHVHKNDLASSKEGLRLARGCAHLQETPASQMTAQVRLNKWR